MKKLLFTYENEWRHLGLLFLRVGLGIMFMYHGWGKISGGTEDWYKLGEKMANMGITFAPTFWGFMAAFSEFFGGIFLILGLFTRPVAFLMFFTMLTATLNHLMSPKKNGFNEASHAIEDGIVFFALIFIGAGKYSLDRLLFNRKTNKLVDENSAMANAKLKTETSRP